MPSSHKLRLSRSFALTTICLNILQHRGRLAGQHGGVERRHRHEEAAEHLVCAYLVRIKVRLKAS